MRKTTRQTTGSLYQNKQGRWIYAVTIGYDGRGKQVRKTVSASTRSECITKRNQLLAEIANNQLSQKHPTIAEWAPQYVAYCRETLSASAIISTDMVTRKHIIPILGKYRLDEIGHDELKEFQTYLIHNRLSRNSLMRYFDVLGGMLQYAISRKVLTVNPLTGFNRAGRVSTVNGGGLSTSRSGFTVEEAKKIITTAYDNEDPLASMWLTAFMLGMRLGELTAMHSSQIMGNSYALEWQVVESKWDHGAGCTCDEGTRPLQCSHREVILPQNKESRLLRNTLILTRPKTTHGMRLIPVPPIVREAWPRHEGFLWHKNNQPEQPLSPPTVRGLFKRAVEAAGVPYRSIHATRHTTASLLLAAGVQPEVIIQIIGHASILTTRTYMHLTEEQGTQALSQVGALLGID